MCIWVQRCACGFKDVHAGAKMWGHEEGERRGGAAGLSVSYTAGAPWQLLLVMGLLWLAVVASLFLLPVTFRPASFQVPGSPLTPSLAILATVHLIGTPPRPLPHPSPRRPLSGAGVVACAGRIRDKTDAGALVGSTSGVRSQKRGRLRLRGTRSCSVGHGGMRAER
jgi:hypothetical protein